MASNNEARDRLNHVLEMYRAADTAFGNLTLTDLALAAPTGSTPDLRTLTVALTGVRRLLAEVGAAGEWMGCCGLWGAPHEVCAADAVRMHG